MLYNINVASQISKIIRDKERIMAKFNKGSNPKATYHMPFEEFDKRLSDSFCGARNLGYIISGLTAEAN